MYPNRIRRTTPKLDPRSLVRFCDLTIDPWAARIESTLQVLIESRCGLENIVPGIVQKNPAEPAPVFLSDLLGDELVPCDVLSPQGRAGYPSIESAHQDAKQMELMATGANAGDLTSGSRAYPARGSP